MKKINPYLLTPILLPPPEGIFTAKNLKQVREQLKKEHPTAKISFKRKTRQFLIKYPLPKDLVRITSIEILS